MQEESATVEVTAKAEERRSLLDELREYARQHRDLARRNYEAFTRQYGKPSDRLRETRERLKAGWTRVRAEAREGYTKLDRDIAAKEARTNGQVAVAKGPNGAS